MKNYIKDMAKVQLPSEIFNDFEDYITGLKTTAPTSLSQYAR
jgi:hypothetical protein